MRKKYNQAILVELHIYNQIKNEIDSIQLQYPTVSITFSVFFEAIVEYWNWSGRLELLELPKSEEDYSQRKFCITQRTYELAIEALGFYQSHKRRMVTRTELAHGLLRHWIDSGRPDIFPYLKVDKH